MARCMMFFLWSMMAFAVSTPAADKLEVNAKEILLAKSAEIVSAGRGTGHWRTYGIPDGLAEDGVWSIFQDKEGFLWFGTLGGASRYDGETFVTFTTMDGLVSNSVRSIFQDREGLIWFGTHDGVSRYDGKRFVTFTPKDGLPPHIVWSTFQDRDGFLWFCTSGGGVSRYDGKEFVTFTEQHGLVSNVVRSMLQDQEGLIWIGTNAGVSRYDGERFTTVTEQDGLARNSVWSISEDREGALWFGTWGGGVSKYDGRDFITFTTEDGLAHNAVRSCFLDQEGALWFATNGGVSRYDSGRFTTLTTQDGLATNRTRLVFQDRDGIYWFCTQGGGVSRYDGEKMTTITTRDGLAHNNVYAIYQDRGGLLWFATNGGESRYDGERFTTLIAQDGLAKNNIRSIVQDRDGALWFGTDGGGITRYRPSSSIPPAVFIDAVLADRRYKDEFEVTISSTVQLTAFEFHATSFKTRPDVMTYRYRLEGYEEEWQTTNLRRVEYPDLPIGHYSFQVLAIDRDLVYSEKPAIVSLIVHPPYRIIALSCGFGLALVGLAISIAVSFKRRQERDRAREALLAEAEQELQTAHDMQMELMPTEAPQIEDFDLAGRCITANRVGGDIFQYFEQDDKLLVAMADVTGHAMDAAIPVVMFSGVLDNQMEEHDSLEEHFAKLNRSMHRNLDSRTFVCFTMAEIGRETRKLRLANGGCPPLYHFQAKTGEVVELETDAYPLGVRADTDYQAIEAQLEPGDWLVFCSDGIPEVENELEEQLGYERTLDVIQQACVEDLSAEETIDRIFEVVNAFRGEADQEDDMTCVVVRVENGERGK